MIANTAPTPRTVALVLLPALVLTFAFAPTEDFRRDSDLFGEGVKDPDTQRLIAAAMKRGLQTRGAELDIARILDA